MIDFSAYLSFAAHLAFGVGAGACFFWRVCRRHSLWFNPPPLPQPLRKRPQRHRRRLSWQAEIWMMQAALRLFQLPQRLLMPCRRVIRR